MADTVEVVIRIPKELYEALLNGYEEPYSRQFSDSVRNGTVLPKGHWINHKDEHQCSNCKEFVFREPECWSEEEFDFCPHCRAKMVAESEDKE